MSNAIHPPAARGVYLAELVQNRPLCHQHLLATLRLKGLPPTRPGQFVQLQCRGLEPQVTAREIAWPPCGLPRANQAELTDREPMLRRPLSLAARRDGSDGTVELDLIYRTLGAGTGWLSKCSAGQPLSLLGPLGNGFTIPDKPLAILIGGGVGIPPMLYLASALNAAGKTSIAFNGARSANLLPLTPTALAAPRSDGQPWPCIEEFSAFCTDAAVTTEDGTMGLRGLVSDAFLHWLRQHPMDPNDVVVYCCGPEPMERAVADICLMRNVECQLALERHMACGVGTCQSCVVKIRVDQPPGWEFKLCCRDGPVFDARDVLW